MRNFSSWIRGYREAEPSPIAAIWLQVLELEDRAVPSISIVFDYRYDTSDFFNTAAKKAELQLAGNTIANLISNQLQAIVPSGSNTWDADFYDPATGVATSLPNLTVAANTITIFVGARSISDSELGIAGSGGFSATGTQSWFNTITSRGQGNTQGSTATAYGPWGGSIAFDSNPTGGGWYFGGSGTTIQSNQYDFFTVASHEIGHILGLGQSPAWSNLIANQTFTGHAAEQVYGGPVPVYTDLSHWANNLTLGNVNALMDPAITAGEQTYFTELDEAALKDIGWIITPTAGGAGNGSSSGSSSTSTIPPIVVGGGFGSDGLITVYNANNTVRFTLNPFNNFGGGMTVATGDVTGSGYDDIIVGVASGGGPHVEVFDGKTGNLIQSFFAFDPGFTGGISVAAGDITGSGHDDIIVGALAGADPHVVVFDGITDKLIRSFDAFDPSFRGGINVAAGDLTDSGHADIIASVYSSGPPHVIAFDGVTNAIIRSFYAYNVNFLGGVNVTSGDVNGDGYDDIIVAPGTGASENVEVFSGVNNSLISSFIANNLITTYGARVAAANLEGNGKADIIVASGPTANPSVLVIQGSSIYPGSTPNILFTLANLDSSLTAGIYVG